MSKSKKSITIPVKGMTCAACVSAVEKSLSGVEGVEKATANFALEKATVDVGEKLRLKNIIKAIKDEGYDVVISKTDLSIKGMTCAACVSAVENALTSRDGVIAALETTEKMIRYFISKVLPRRWFVKPRMVIGVPTGVKIFS